MIKKILELFRSRYIKSGFMYSGNLSVEEIQKYLKLTTPPYEQIKILVKRGLIQIRDCDAFCYELTIKERKKLIEENNLGSHWERLAPYFYPNSEYGEVTQVMKNYEEAR